jgi:hypothetical protein
VGPAHSDQWLSSCKILTQRIKKFLEALWNIMWMYSILPR